MAVPSQSNDLPPEYLAEYSGARLIVANSIILVVATTLLALRLYARSLTNASRGWDEFLLPPAWILLLGLGIVIYSEKCSNFPMLIAAADSRKVTVSFTGVGRHVQAVVAEDPHKLVTWAKLIYILDWFYVPSNMLSRLSIVLLYLRIFTNKTARFFCWVVVTFLIFNCITAIIAAQLECSPLAYTWDKTIKGGRCFDQMLWYKLTNFPNVIADVAIFLLPVQTIWTLKASIARRAGIALVCLTGSVFVNGAS